MASNTYSVKNQKLAGSKTQLLGQIVEFDDDGVGEVSCDSESYLAVIGTKNFSAVDDKAEKKAKADTEAKAKEEADAKAQADADAKAAEEEAQKKADEAKGDDDEEEEEVETPSSVPELQKALDGWEVEYKSDAKYATLLKAFNEEKAKREEDKNNEG